ncbi:hypothetical protein LDENG_00289060 [Lucifuga dentata]|nr:hypothetical protein LDENG_00289060 [Lucifuga dentata]
MTDSAGSDSLRAAFLNQGQRLHQHEQLLATLTAGMQQLQMPLHLKLLQAQRVRSLNPAFLLMSPGVFRLRDTMGTLPPVVPSCTPGREAARGLLHLRQGKGRVADYAIKFRILAADRGWNNHSLTDTFLHGLAEEVKDQLAPLDLPADLDSLVSLAIKIDNRLSERRRERSQRPALFPIQRWHHQSESGNFQGPSISVPSASSASSVPEEPMQLGRTRLTPEECQRRVREGRCNLDISWPTAQ